MPILLAVSMKHPGSIMVLVRWGGTSIELVVVLCW